MYGTGDIRFVITVAPQKDICPHGSTYPIKAVAIVMNKIDPPHSFRDKYWENRK
jgi:hypothetical protein